MGYKYWRCCDCDHKVVTNKMIHAGECAGHKIKPAEVVWPWQLFYIYIIWPLKKWGSK